MDGEAADRAWTDDAEDQVCFVRDLERRSFPPGGHVPPLDRGVGTPRRQGLAVGREGQRMDAALVPREDVSLRPGAGDVPELDRPVTDSPTPASARRPGTRRTTRGSSGPSASPRPRRSRRSTAGPCSSSTPRDIGRPARRTRRGPWCPVDLGARSPAGPAGRVTSHSRAPGPQLPAARYRPSPGRRRQSWRRRRTWGM